MSNAQTLKCSIDLLAAVRELQGVTPENIQSLEKLISDLKAGVPYDKLKAKDLASELQERLVTERFMIRAASDRASKNHNERMARVGAKQGYLAIKSYLEPIAFGESINLDGVPLTNRIQGEIEIAMTKWQPFKDLMVRDRLGVMRSDPNFGRKALLEIGGLDTGDADAKRVAGGFADILSPLIDSLVKNGLPINKIDYYLPGAWSMYKMHRDIDATVKAIAPRLSESEHRNPTEAVKSYFSKVRHQQGNAPEKNPLLMRKQWSFKSHEEFVDTLMEFGDGDPWEILEQHIRKIARLSRLVDEKGPNPWGTITTEIELAELAARGAGVDVGRVAKVTHDAKAALQMQSGEALASINPTMDQFGRMGASINVMQALGGAGLFLPTDAMNAVTSLARMRPRGMPHPAFQMINRFTKGIGKQFDEFASGKRGEIKSEIDEMLSMMGGANAVHQAHLADRVAPFTLAAESAGDMTQKWRRGVAGADKKVRGWADAFYRMTLAPAGTRAIQEGHAYILGRYFGHYAQHPVSWTELSKVNGGMHRTLKESGWGAREWDTIIRADHVTDGLIDPRKITDARAQNTFVGAMDLMSQFAVNRPDDFTRRWAMGPFTQGTVGSVLWRWGFQFGSFPMSFARQAVAQAARGGVASAAVGFALPMFLAGMGVVQLRQFLQGKPMYESDSPILWAASLNESGIAYVVSALAQELAEENAHGGTGGGVLSGVAGRMTGPMMDTMIFNSESFVRNISKALDEESEEARNARVRVIKTLVRQIPGHNFPLLSGVAVNPIRDYFLQGVQPNYDALEEKRLKEKGQTVYLFGR